MTASGGVRTGGELHWYHAVDGHLRKERVLEVGNLRLRTIVKYRSGIQEDELEVRGGRKVIVILAAERGQTPRVIFLYSVSHDKNG